MQPSLTVLRIRILSVRHYSTKYTSSDGRFLAKRMPGGRRWLVRDRQSKREIYAPDFKAAEQACQMRLLFDLAGEESSGVERGVKAGEWRCFRPAR